MVCFVQRGDAEMAQKLWRVVRACVELGPGNPIQQIHDQGAGGNCNVVCSSAQRCHVNALAEPDRLQSLSCSLAGKLGARNLAPLFLVGSD